MVSGQTLKYYRWTGEGCYGMTSGSWIARDEDTLKAELEAQYHVKVKKAFVIDEILTPNEVRKRLRMKPIRK